MAVSIPMVCGCVHACVCMFASGVTFSSMTRFTSVSFPPMPPTALLFMACGKVFW